MSNFVFVVEPDYGFGPTAFESAEDWATWTVQQGYDSKDQAYCCLEQLKASGYPGKTVVIDTESGLFMWLPVKKVGP